MSRMKVVFPLIFVCAGVILASTALIQADTVTLKSGETLSGTILDQNDQEIVMDVTVAPGITDQKTIPKGDVKSSVKTPADELAFQDIRGLQIESHSLPLARYAAIIKSLETFLKQYPQSPRANGVKTTLEAFKKEQTHAKTGELKWNNRWYTAKEAEKNRYQLNAQMALSAMKEQASRRDFIGALNTFALIEATYPGSTAYPDAAEIAQNMVRIAVTDGDRIQTYAKVQESQFNSGIVLVPEPQKSQMIAARLAQVTAADASIAAADRAGIKWKPLLPVSSKSFENLKSTLNSEAPRIEKIPIAAMRDSITAAGWAQEELDAKNVENADAKITEAEKLWNKNEQLPSLKAGLAALKESLKPKPTPPPKATPTPPPTPTPASSPSSKKGAVSKQ